MIIGKDNFPKNTPNFQNKPINLNNNQTQMPNNQYVDIGDKKNMADQSFELLQYNLEKGLISLDEFKRKCDKLGKFREK